MSYHLSRAQRRFQQIKAREAEMVYRRTIEANIIMKLEMAGHQVNMTVVRNMANRAVREDT